MKLDPKEYFTTNPTGNVALKGGAPEELLDYVREAHGAAFPSNWVWSKCAEMWGALCEGQELHEAIDSAVDIYYKDLFDWLADNPERRSFCDEAVDAGITPNEADLVRIIQGGQYYMIEQIANTMELAYRELVEFA
jgi:hypothetical protein